MLKKVEIPNEAFGAGDTRLMIVKQLSIRLIDEIIDWIDL